MVLRDRVLAHDLCCLFFVCVGEVQGVTKLLGLKQLCCLVLGFEENLWFNSSFVSLNLTSNFCFQAILLDQSSDPSFILFQRLITRYPNGQ
jgi:hypothetical protein